MLLGTQAQWVVGGEAGTPEEAIVIAAQMQPDLILLEPLITNDRELRMLSTLQIVARDSRILILTGCPDPQLHRRVASLGARGIVLKSQPSLILFRALHRIMAGERWVEPQLTGYQPNPPGGGWNPVPKTVGFGLERKPGTSLLTEQEKLDTLTPREREVVALVCQGMKNKEIANRLFVSEKTVRNSLTIVFNKLEVRNRLELFIFGVQQGLAEPHDSTL